MTGAAVPLDEDVPQGEDAPVALPDPSVRHLLLPKWLAARARASSEERGRGARMALLALFGLLFWAFIFALLYRLLVYFRGVAEIGPLLAGKLLGLMLISFMGILLLSNVITALSSFFLARDLDMLVAAPVDWLKLYTAKLLETLLHSSWMVVLLAIPILTAYGVAYRGGPLFPLIALAVFLPFLIVPTVIGSAITLLLVNVFPARRTKDILSVIAVLTAGGLVLLFRMLQPERFARPEQFRSLVDFIALLRGPTSPYLPSEWVASGVMSWLTGSTELLPFYLLWSTAGAAIVLGALLHRAMYAKGFSKAQESGGGAPSRPGLLARSWYRALSPLGVVRRELLAKEVRVFFRDTTQWSQLILLAVLVVVYVFNIRYLPLRQGNLSFVLVNIVPFLNLGLAGFVLAAIAARFIFPAVSLEGRTLWLLRSSPMSMGALLWAKFWAGTFPLLILALGIVGTTNIMLETTTFMFWLSLGTVSLLTIAIGALAIGFGTIFPQFDTENAAQIPTSFGGLLFMMASVALIAVVVVIQARPVYGYVAAQAWGLEPDPRGLVVGLAAAAAVCIIATVLPLRLALRRLERLER